MWCAGLNGGHRAPDEWERDGKGTGMQKTRFFHASGKNIDMKVCELCMTVAHWMADQERKGRP